MGGRLSDLQREILLLCLESRFVTCQTMLRLVFGGREYNVAHATLSRTLTRLWGRGLIRYWRTLSHYSTAITLTAAGETLAKAILADAENEQ